MTKSRKRSYGRSMYDRSAAAIYDAMNRGAGKDYGAEAAAVTEAVLARRPGGPHPPRRGLRHR